VQDAARTQLAEVALQPSPELMSALGLAGFVQFDATRLPFAFASQPQQVPHLKAMPV
jgi:hypothetical protein